MVQKILGRRKRVPPPGAPPGPARGFAPGWHVDSQQPLSLFPDADSPPAPPLLPPELS